MLGNFELEKYSDCQVKWANNVAERVFVYNKTFREKNFKESDIAGIFTLGQATTEEIQEINKKKADLEDLKRNIIANKNTIESLNSKIQKEEADFKEIIWKDVYKANEDKFKAAFVGFMKKDTFSSKVKGIELSRNENVDRDEIEKRAIKLLGDPPEKKDGFNKLAIASIKQIENLSIWDKCIVGKRDIPIADLIIKLGNSDWVNQGRKFLYSGSQCPFCQKNTIDDAFKKQLEDFFDEEFERDVELLKTSKIQYLCQKEVIISFLESIENYDFEYDEKLKIQQLKEKLVNCFRNNELQIDEKINEPGKKIKITSVEDIVDEINKIIEIKNIEVKKHNNLVDNYQEEKKKLICDIWYLIAEENSELISQHKNKVAGFMHRHNRAFGGKGSE